MENSQRGGQRANLRMPASWLPILAVLFGLVALEVGYGAPFGDAILYLGYGLLFRVLPGWLLYRVLSSNPGGAVRQVALGWTLGSVLEVFAFMLAAWLGIRDLFVLFPLLVSVPAVVILLRRKRIPGTPENETGPRFAWALATICVLAMGLLAVAYFPTVPNPGSGTFAYFRDYIWHLGFAGEIKHHWPPLDFNVSGEPFPYHYFVHVQMAASSQVTGIELPVVFFRLYNLPLMVLAVLLSATAGRSLGRNVWVGLLAACLVFFVGDLDMLTGSGLNPAPFLGNFFIFLYTSPSFIFGLTLFLALVTLIGERLTDTSRGLPGDWVLLAILIAGATNAKVAILPLVLCALALFGAWVWLRERRVPAPIGWIGAMIGIALAVTYFSQYAGHSSGLEIGSFDSFFQMPAPEIIRVYLDANLPGIPLESAILRVGAVVFGLIGLLGAQLVAIGWLATGGRKFSPGLSPAWLVALLAGGILVLCFVFAGGLGNQLYFVAYATTAGWIAAAIGFRALWLARPEHLNWTRLSLAGACWLLLLILIQRLPAGIDLFSGPDAGSQTYLFLYVGLLVLLVLFSVVISRIATPAGWSVPAFLACALAVVGLLGTLTSYVEPALDKSSTPEGAATSPTSLTPARYGALAWIRENTDQDAVIAINDEDPYNFNWATFAERRAFIQGWAYTREALDEGYEDLAAGGANNLFLDRRLLNAAAFAADPASLATLSDDFGVEYLIVDTTGSLSADGEALRPFTEIVYEGDGIAVLRLEPEALPAPAQ